MMPSSEVILSERRRVRNVGYKYAQQLIRGDDVTAARVWLINNRAKYGAAYIAGYELAIQEAENQYLWRLIKEGVG